MSETSLRYNSATRPSRPERSGPNADFNDTPHPEWGTGPDRRGWAPALGGGVARGRDHLNQRRSPRPTRPRPSSPRASRRRTPRTHASATRSSTKTHTATAIVQKLGLPLLHSSDAEISGRRGQAPRTPSEGGVNGVGHHSTGNSGAASGNAFQNISVAVGGATVTTTARRARTAEVSAACQDRSPARRILGYTTGDWHADRECTGEPTCCSATPLPSASRPASHTG